MNLYTSLLRSMPTTAFKLNQSATGYDDVSGNGHVLSATPDLTAPITNGNSKSMVVKASSTASTSIPVLRRGSEQNSFTVEVWVLPLTFTGTVSIFSHTGTYDGLAFDGNNIRFRVKLATLGDIDLTWPVPDFTEAYHVVATYSSQKVQLFVNRDLVAEDEIDEAQLSDGFATEPSSYLYAGQSASGNERIVIDGLAVFNRVLSVGEVVTHFASGRDVPSVLSNVSQNGGAVWDGTARDIIMTEIFTGVEGWSSGEITNASYASDVLLPDIDVTTGESLAGVWNGSVAISTTDSTSLQGIRVGWNGDGLYTVESSLDGTTFTPLTNGNLVANSVNLDSTGKTLDIRITFTGGIIDDTSLVRDLSVVVYTSDVVHGSDESRTLQLVGNVSTAREANEPIERNSAAGMTFYGGHATLSPDINTGTPEVVIPEDDAVQQFSRSVGAIEFWINPAAVAIDYVFDARPAYNGWVYIDTGMLLFSGQAALYVNGVATTSNTKTLTVGERVHLLYVFSTPIDSTIILGSRYSLTEVFLGQIESVATYPIVLTASQALALFNSYSGVPQASVVDPVPVSVSELSNSYTTTSFEWSIVGAGG